jgi:L-ribulose-5-phosphate 3-epimerase
MRAFQLGVITDEISQNLDEVINLAKKYALDTLEFRSVDDRAFHSLSDEQIEQIHLKVIANGLSICALSTPIFKCELDQPEELAEHFRIAERAIAIAQKVNAKIIRGFSFWAKQPFEQAVPQIVEQLQKLIPLLEQSGITFALEFDPSVYASNARKVRMLLDEVNSPHILALYDPGNDLWDPDGETPYPDGYNYLKDKICHIHLKDATRTAEGVVGVAIGEGEVDYKGLFQRLVDDQYQGYLVVETHYRLKSKLTEEQLKRPAGNSFSLGGMEATEQCLESLLRIL